MSFLDLFISVSHFFLLVSKGCDYVTNLVGVVTIGDPMILVMELVPLGDMHSYLQNDAYWNMGRLVNDGIGA